MPHVVLKGSCAPEEVLSDLKPVLFKGDGVFLRTGEAYLGSRKKSILVESVAVEGDGTQNFLSMVKWRDDGLVVLIYPGSTVRRTEGVRRLIALVAAGIMASHPYLTVEETNLNDFLHDGR
jgi:hypothetical protein